MHSTYCLKCRAILAPSIQICPRCGHDQRTGPPPPPPPPPPTPAPSPAAQPDPATTGTVPGQKVSTGKSLAIIFALMCLLFALQCVAFNLVTRAVQGNRQREAELLQTISAQGQESNDEWVPAAEGIIKEGTEVYYRSAPGETPSLWFTIVNPYIEGERPEMRVRWPEGNVEQIGRYIIMTGEGTRNGHLVVRR